MGTTASEAVQPGKVTLSCSFSPVSVLQSIDHASSQTSTPECSSPRAQNPGSGAAPGLPVGEADTLRQPHRLLVVHSLLHLQPQEQPQEQMEQQEQEQEQRALRVSVGEWTPERRLQYHQEASAASLGGQFKCVLPDECPALAGSLGAEVDAVVALLERLGGCTALHFSAGDAAISGKHTSEAMLRLLRSWRFLDLQAGPGRLRQLGVHGWLASRELCAQLPALPGLRRLLLSGCHMRLDMRPLRQLSRLRELVLESDLVPDLGQLPPGLQRLELNVAGVGTRVHLPPSLRLSMLRVSCPDGRIFASAPALLRQCGEVRLECGTAVLLGLLDGLPQLGGMLQPEPDAECAAGTSSSATRLIQEGAAALVAAFLRLPAQLLRLQARRLAFARPCPPAAYGCQSPDGWPQWPHQLRYVAGSSSSSWDSVLAAALPHWQQLEAAELGYCPAAAPVVLPAPARGLRLCKRSAAGRQRGVYCLPPLGQLSAAGRAALALAAAPTELRFAPACSAAEQASLLRAMQAGGAPPSRLRRLRNLRLCGGTDLSGFAGLESVSGTCDCGLAGAAPSRPLPRGVRQLALTCTSGHGAPAAVLQGAALLAGFTGSLTARGFSAVRLPASCSPLQLELELGLGLGPAALDGSTAGASRALDNDALQLGGRVDRLLVRLLPAPPGAAAGDSCQQLQLTLDLDSRWLGQAGLVVVDMRPACGGGPTRATSRTGSSSSKGSKGSSHGSSSTSIDSSSSSSSTNSSMGSNISGTGSGTSITNISGSSSGGSAPLVQLAFAGGCLADLFSGALRSAAASGLRRLEVLCGPRMERFNCAALRFVALAGSAVDDGTAPGGARRAYDLRDLRQLAPAQRAGWRVSLAADPWRLVLQHAEGPQCSPASCRWS